MIVDVHTHAWPDKVAQAAREHLEKSFGCPLKATPTVSALLCSMDECGIDLSVIAAVATRPDQVGPINRWLFSLREDRLRAFASMHPAFGGWKDELKRIRDNALGIKLQPEFQRFYVDDEGVFRLYEALEEWGVPVLFHAGEELSGTETVHASPARLAAVHRRFPGMKMIAAHFGGFRLWDEVAQHLAGTGVYLDTSFTLGHIDEGLFSRIVARHDPTRILFGSDFPMAGQRPGIDRLLALEMPPDRTDRILSRNARELLNLP